MKKQIAILIDLDDTLLGNDMDQFLPGYLHALAQALPDIPESKMINVLMSGTNKMLTKTMPENTLAEVFNAYFYPGIGINKEYLDAQITSFYKHDFSKLQSLTSTKPETIELIRQIKLAGHPIVIATNPLFPSAAQYHRLEWAGFPTTDGLFDEVTSFENFHFCKPHPEYYAEIIFKNGFANMPAVMIGNSLDDDILPAEQLGLSTYWITTNPEKHPQQGPLSAAGKLSGVLSWLEKIEPKINALEWNTNLNQSIISLKATPAVFEDFALKYPIDFLTKKTEDGKWSVCEILLHLLNGDKQLNISRIKNFYTDSQPFITSMDLDDLSTTCQDPIADYHHLLSQFFIIRSELLSLIASASAHIKNKQTIHTIFGPTSFNKIIELIAIHDRKHIQQCLKQLKTI